MTDGQRSALIIACDDYHDTGLRKLRAPARDAQELAAVLSDPEVGGFDVRTSLNEPAHVIGETVEEFFADRGTDDLLLVHFSCHGVKDEDGELYFAATNTKLRRLGATAVAAEFVNRRMNRSRSRRIVLLLDCCYAGAFERGMTHRADTGMNLQEQLSGRGRAVITASSAMEYSFESGELADAAGERPSLFTGALVDGLRTGEADRNQDGLITLDDLYDYVYARVRACSPHQTPLKWAFGVQGELYIARRTRRLAYPIPLPEELEQLLGSPLPSVREAAVRELAKLVVGKHLGMAEAAVRALEELLADDSRAVSAAAAAALRAAAPTPAPLLASGAPAAERTPGREPAAAVPDPGPPPTRIDPPRSVDDRPSADDHDTRDRHPARSADGGTGRGESAARPSTASQPGLRPPGPRSGDGDRHASHRTASSTTRGRTPRHPSAPRSPVPGPPVPADRARRDSPPSGTAPSRPPAPNPRPATTDPGRAEHGATDREHPSARRGRPQPTAARRPQPETGGDAATGPVRDHPGGGSVIAALAARRADPRGLRRLAGLGLIAAAAMMATYPFVPSDTDDRTLLDTAEYYRILVPVLGLAALVGLTGLALLSARLGRHLGSGFALGLCATTPWYLWSLWGPREYWAIGTTLWFGAHLTCAVAAGLLVGAMLWTDGVSVRNPLDPVAALIAGVGVVAWVGAVVHGAGVMDNWPGHHGWGPAWLMALAFVVPACAVAVSPRGIGVAGILGWCAGLTVVLVYASLPGAALPAAAGYPGTGEPAGVAGYLLSASALFAAGVVVAVLLAPAGRRARARAATSAQLSAT